MDTTTQNKQITQIMYFRRVTIEAYIGQWMDAPMVSSKL